MAHYMRVISTKTEAPALPDLVKQLQKEGFTFETFPVEDDERYMATDWRTLHLAYDRNVGSLMLDRSGKGEESFEEDVTEFRENLGEGENAGQVKEILDSAVQIFACYIPDEITEQGWELTEKLLEILLDSSGGTLQVDGEGFFDQEGELIYEME